MTATIGTLAAKLLGAASLGAVGAAVIAAFDPPKTRMSLYLQTMCAAVGSIVFGPATVLGLDAWADFVDLHAVSIADYLAWTAPVFFLVGALSWGAYGALAHLRSLIRDRGAETIADKVGLHDESH